jgi:hypothetical protein
MFILDFLANWGVYAPILLGAWITIAYGVAGRRARRRIRTATQLSWVQLNMVNGLISSLWGVIMFRSPGDLSAPIWVGVFATCFPLIFIRSEMRRFEIGPSLGYAHVRDILLFRAPAAEQSADALEPAPPSVTDRRTNRLTYLLVLSVAILLTIISFIGVSLRPCEWLDITAHRSGCLLSIAIDAPPVVNYVAFSLDGSTLTVASNWSPGFDMVTQLYRVSDGTLVGEFEPAWGKPSFSPDGSLLASVTGAYTVSVWDARTGGLIYNLQTLPADVTKFRPDTVGFSPDGIGYKLRFCPGCQGSLGFLD